MTDLIRDLEQAKTGSRKLSDRILLACGWSRGPGYARGNKHECVFFRPNGSKTVGVLPQDRPDPSRSLDDALALVPEGKTIELLIEPHHKQADIWGCVGDAETAPLAVCIAVLKAEQQKEQDR